MKRGWSIWLVILLALLCVGLALWAYFRNNILPFSSRYNSDQAISSTPQGVADTAKQKAASKVQLPVATILTSIQGQALASRDFAKPATMRLDVVDASGQVLQQSSATTVTLTSSSLGGQFEHGWAAYIPSGRQSIILNYRDTVSGRPTISSFVSGLKGGSLVLTIDPGSAIGLSEISPSLHNPKVGQTTIYIVSLLDSFGNAATGGNVAWVLSNNSTSQQAQAGNKVEISQPADDIGRSSFSLTPNGDQAGQNWYLEAHFGQSKQSLLITPQA